MGKCYIWKTPAEGGPQGDGTFVNSPRAGGKYVISGSAVPLVEKLTKSERVLVTDHIVEQNSLGVTPQITSYDIDSLIKRRPRSTEDRATAMIRYLRDQSKMLGELIRFLADGNEPLPAFLGLLAHTSSMSKTEFESLAGHCEEQGWLKRPRRFDRFCLA